MRGFPPGWVSRRVSHLEIPEQVIKGLVNETTFKGYRKEREGKIICPIEFQNLGSMGLKGMDANGGTIEMRDRVGILEEIF